MAAYAALVSAARTLDECCNDVHVLSHEKEQIESLHQIFVSLQAFLEDFPEEAEHLEGRIRDVVHLAEDLIEDSMLKRLGSNGEDVHVGDLINEEFQKVAQEIHSIEEEMMMIKNSRGVPDNVMEINDYSSSAASTSRAMSSSEEPAPPSSKDVAVGLEGQLTQIQSKLCGESLKRKVIPIFGMGGIGKTTLARNTFDDRLTEERFDLRAWVTVSQTYSVQEIFHSLLVSCKVLDATSTSNESLEWLKERLYKSLKGRRYLIVLDDIWSTKAWDDVSRMFPDDNNGSRVLLTTRISEVAAYAGDASDHHSMEFLNEDQSWDLLREKVFSSDARKGNDYIYHPELEDIGKGIAIRCAGLPLTIVVIAGILRNVHQTRAAWEEMARKVNTVAVGESSIANVLSLSYKHLPHHLRPCLLYMAAFPEDYEIRVSHLSKLWMAEGFLKPAGTNNRSKSLEETAEEYLEDLVRRSLVLAGKRDICNGKIKSCSVHDLLRDMCIRKAEEEKFLIRISKEFDKSVHEHQNMRRVSTDDLDGLLEIIEQHYSSFATIRTLLCFDKSHYYRSLVPSNARFLRIIHAPATDFSDIYPEVFSLLQLRYLNLYLPHRQITLPKDYKLTKLQTLTLGGACIVYPLEIQKMPRLRHLEADAVMIFPFFTVSFSTPVSIQSLSRTLTLCCSAEILKLMPSLKELGLLYYSSEHADDFSCYHLENLVRFGELENLKLHIGSSLYKWRISSTNFAPPKMLRKLVLWGCNIQWEEIGIIASSLPNLECLRLGYNVCTGQVWETEEGQFPRLKMLKLRRLYSLKQWITESSHFPRLECLNVYECYEFELPDGIGEIPTLQVIKVQFCSESLAASAKRIKCEQEDMGDYGLRLQISTAKEDEDGYNRVTVEEL